ncbi:uncharacterized protein PpBr36_06319 [Pyricularia pennisetigena]|uniref:uncharacterized protein n=1 Tax=Pyricularia pennisetigena TaxID=1578925 RepID=UPI0011512021|nr:uncharacterized protein PpBr36_06319 [Pyricularia pennisetigena]TLS23414.1 hypothetical protein PpBr36_06319 [Pyricularia pennisetigena]
MPGAPSPANSLLLQIHRTLQLAHSAYRHQTRRISTANLVLLRIQRTITNRTGSDWKAATRPLPQKHHPLCTHHATERATVRFFRTTATMASDESYMDFLNKANEDPSACKANSSETTSSSDFRSTESGIETPAVLVKATKDAFYMSEADEPFVPVALGWEKGLPNEEEFAKLIHHWDAANAQVEIMDLADWDVQGQYNDLLEAVREAGKGNDVRVYRVPGKKSSRVEYWLVTTTGDKLVGVKALSIES